MAKQSGILALRHQPSLQAVTYLECWVRLKEYTVHKYGYSRSVSKMKAVEKEVNKKMSSINGFNIIQLSNA